MSNIIPFTYDEMPIRVVMRNSEPIWVAQDVCAILDLGNTKMALERLDDDEKGVSSIDTPGGKQKMQVVNEPGLYSLILGSRKPEAKAFKRWITHEVIPSIRKTGQYKTGPDPIKAEKDAAYIQNAKTRQARLLLQTAKDFKSILPEISVQALVAAATNTMTGVEVLPMPMVDRTYTATEIALEAGTTANMVGRLAEKHGLKTDAFGRLYLDKSPYSAKQVESFRYNQRGRETLLKLAREVVKS